MRFPAFYFTITVAAFVAGCAPFSMDNAKLKLESTSNFHTQSYYLPKTLLTASITEASGKKNLTAGWEKTTDRDYLFKVNYERSIVHEDDFYIETDDKGFLKEIQAYSTDKTKDIVEAAAKIFMTTISGVPSGDNRSMAQATSLEAQLLIVQFDPFDAKDFSAHNRLIKKHGFCFAVFDRSDQPLPGSCSPSHHHDDDHAWHPTTQKLSRPHLGSGFFYRRQRDHRVIIYKRAGKGWQPTWSGWHPFEQGGELLELRVDRGAFIKLEAKLNFTEGNLTKFTMKKPSELLGFMAIPTTIVNTIVQIPGLQVTAAENANALRERELNAREKELQLRERQLKLVPIGTTADNRSVFAEQNALRSASTRDKATFIRLCLDRYGVTPADCEAAWVRDRS